MTTPDAAGRSTDDEAMDRYLDAVRQNQEAASARRTPPFGAGAIEVLARRAGLDPVSRDAAEKRERRARAKVTDNDTDTDTDTRG